MRISKRVYRISRFVNITNKKQSFFVILTVALLVEIKYNEEDIENEFA